MNDFQRELARAIALKSPPWETPEQFWAECPDPMRMLMWARHRGVSIERITLAIADIEGIAQVLVPDEELAKVADVQALPEGGQRRAAATNLQHRLERIMARAGQGEIKRIAREMCGAVRKRIPEAPR